MKKDMRLIDYTAQQDKDTGHEKYNQDEQNPNFIIFRVFLFGGIGMVDRRSWQSKKGRTRKQPGK
ncbi:MAG TPA: hypothetical protein IAC91_05705 [Candidatus Faecimorpha stercoravium]|nr:hypothetical protein [Candidatus Faecimorpha stercoravium]